jgi:2',3'-cyclic-nucleotide 2'-phosphodiesterase (5'-nucleotidase family)
VNKTLVHKSGVDGKWLGRIDLNLKYRIHKFNEKIIKTETSLPSWSMILNKGFKPDKECDDIINFYYDQLPKDRIDVIAFLEKPLSSSTKGFFFINLKKNKR